ncbi:bifunctional serine/threonine-protein kinase/formylglycine-generating enzyme family protein [Prosthecobacter sp.]|uniref:bifunctional serine/threonine-protein kinase/formylglycine-generating enzyme family protein n=1 Tax=Prosthecobacter sp. TaxID=1965333 RepID=UPI0025CCE0DA|nr:bifunctional serine/threonine-protein kinase/formylglycine-generating enzyme family protein [Prosthecobacter sp.]
MGAVYKGTQKSLDRPVAIKILSATLDESDQGFAERFKNEARALGKLKHPGIVGVYDFGTATDGLLYIVMEYVDGTDVAKMIAQKGRLHTDHAMAITAHVCDALAYAHERGIIHRDIKPANIMVGYDGVVQVADFGLAKVSTDGQTLGLTQSGMAMGTLHYMAPESLMLGSAVDHRADIYAVGVMLYQMLTGKLPQGMFELPSLLVPGLDPRYDDIIAKALREDRDARYPSIGEMRRDLDGILTQPVIKVEEKAEATPAALPTHARPQRSGGQPQRPSQPGAKAQASKPRSSNAWLVWAVVGIVVIGIGAAMFLSGPQDRSLKQAAAESAPDDPSSLPPPAEPDTPQARVASIPTPEPTKEAPFTNTLGMKFVPVPGTDVLFCIHETRYNDYAAYAADSAGVDETWKNQIAEKHKITNRPTDHPVVNVNWEDAQRFCKWLSQKENKSYRLPTDREWSIAVGLGDVESRDGGSTPADLDGKETTMFPWGSQFPPRTTDRVGNYGDASRNGKITDISGYVDGFPTTAPVMQFSPNSLGLYDMGGNVFEWCEDWSDATHRFRVLRGGSWGVDKRVHLQSSLRYQKVPGQRNPGYGFRIVVAADTASSPSAKATRIDGLVANGEWQDVLGLLRNVTPTTRGNWEMGDRGISCTEVSFGAFFCIPSEPLDEYTARIRFLAQSSHGIGFYLPVKTGGMQFFLYDWAGKICLMGKEGSRLESISSQPKAFKAGDGVEHELMITVNSTGIEAKIDGKKVYDWAPEDWGMISQPNGVSSFHPVSLGLNAHRGVVEFHSFEIRIPPGADSNSSSAQDTVSTRDIPELSALVATQQKRRHGKLSDLTGKYQNALARAEAEAIKSGELAHVEAVRQAVERAKSFAAQIETLPTTLTVTPLPALPMLDDNVPDSLKRLRTIFDQEVAKIESDFQAELNPALDALQASLIESGRKNHAELVKQFQADPSHLPEDQPIAPAGPSPSPLRLAPTHEEYLSKAPAPAGRPVSEKYNYVESNETMGVLHWTFQDSRLPTERDRVISATLRLHTANIRLAATRDIVSVRHDGSEVGTFKGAPINWWIDIPLNVQALPFEQGVIELTLHCGNDAVVVNNLKSGLPPELVLEVGERSDTSDKEAPTVGANASSKSWIDLIAAVDPVKDVSRWEWIPAATNIWKKNGSELLFPQNQRPGEIQFPGTEGVTDFQLKMSFTREMGSKGFDFKIPTGHGATSIVFAAETSNAKIMLVRPMKARGGIELGNFAIQNGRRYDLSITFLSNGASAGITVAIDGEEVAVWKGNYRTDLDVIPEWKSNRLGLWIYGDRSSQYRFHEVLFRPILP